MNFTYVTQKNLKKFKVSRPEKYVFFVHNVTGELHIDITTPNAEVFIYGLYIGRNNEEFSLKTIQRHVVGDSVSDLLIRGVFFDESKFFYEGLIRIEEKAHKSNAYQKNQNLVMSPQVFIDSRPYLEILADDVRCTHGSTTGRINQEMLLYMQSRGLSKNEAENLIIQGFVDDLLNKVPELNSIQRSIIEELMNMS